MTNARKVTRRYRRVAMLLLTGFLAFAPPGTMIFVVLLIVGLFGRTWLAWLAAGGIFGMVVLAVAANIVRRRRLMDGTTKQ